MQSDGISVIIVTWNVRDLTLQCLAALERQGVPLEIFVVDNASTDGTPAAIRERYPSVNVISNSENVGFPRANNQALARATGRYILFLNPDTVVRDGVLAGCARELDSDPSLGMVGTRLVYADGGVQYEAARRTYHLRHLLIETLYLHMFFPNHRIFGDQLLGDWDHLGSRDVEAISGAFMMVRAEIAYALGGLPEKIFMYHEDLSFCLRVQRAGWKIRYLGDLVTVHHVQQSARKTNARLDLLEGESKIELIREAQGPVYALVARGVFAIRSALRLTVASVAFLIPGMARTKARYARALHVNKHFLQLVWSVCPVLTRGIIPKAPPRATTETLPSRLSLSPAKED